MKVIVTIILLWLGLCAQAQYTVTIKLLGEESAPMAGATIQWKEGNLARSADTSGIVRFEKVAAGSQTFQCSFVGYREEVLLVQIASDTIITMIMTPEEEEEEEVVVTATRTSRTISNATTRVEVISGEELEEKGNMKPGDIRMLLNESTGIQTQQTSAISYNAGIRIQGLDGRYTQILKDGYPMYAGFSGGLSLLQITPLDLRQVEVIKGSASTLYGGGAIAGLVNLVSKTPGEKRELSFMANATSARGLDLSGFYSERFGATGLTFFASRNTTAAYDPADIGLTAIPRSERYTVNPRFFVYGKKLSFDAGVFLMNEDRVGGDMDYIKDGGAGYFEDNNTRRVITQAGLTWNIGENSIVQLKNSLSFFNRAIAIPSYRFEGDQKASFSELTWKKTVGDADWVVGASFQTDRFSEEGTTAPTPRDYSLNTLGAFVQNTWTVSPQFALETGIRVDRTNNAGTEVLPRISARYVLSPSLSTRLGGGFGYKQPTIFTEETERFHFRNLLPVNFVDTKNERSVGGNWDLNYRGRIGEIGLSLNQLFFYTRLNNPLQLTTDGSGMNLLVNSNGYIDTKGAETNVRLVWEQWKLFLGYTYTDAAIREGGNDVWLPLTARHRLNNVLMFEVEEKWKIGLEAYYFSPQRLNNGESGRSFWTTGFMAEKLWERFSVFINFENFTDTRQTRFGPIFDGTLSNPVFRDIYAPLDGFVINGGLKLRL